MSKKPGKEERAHPAFEFGTDRDFQAFVRELPSAISGRGPCVFAHHRNAKNAGTGYRPPFSGVPLTWDEHERQHRVGQYNFKPRGWWDAQVRRCLGLWIESVERARGDASREEIGL